MSSRVHCYMRWGPKARNRFLDRQFMVPTIRTIIADDEALARQKLRILLTAESGIHIVTECKNSRETAGALQAHKPDLLLLDVQMPDVDGFEVLRTLRERPATRDLPVIVVTAKDLTEEDRKRLARSAEQVILKQALRVDDLRTEIRGLLAAHRARDVHHQTEEGKDA